MRMILSQTGVLPDGAKSYFFVSSLWVHLSVSNKRAIVIHTGLFSTLSDLSAVRLVYFFMSFQAFLGRHKEPLFQHVHLSYQQSAE